MANKVKISSEMELKDRLVAINRVTKVTKGGRTFTFAAIVVVSLAGAWVRLVKSPQPSLRAWSRPRRTLYVFPS